MFLSLGYFVKTDSVKTCPTREGFQFIKFEECGWLMGFSLLLMIR